MVGEAGDLAQADWYFEVISECQRAVGELLEADGHGFSTAFQRLAERLPSPECPMHSLFLHDRLQAFAAAADRHFHARHHSTSGNTGCAPAKLAATHSVWSATSWMASDARRTLLEWSSRYQAVFEETHPRPAADRAAEVLLTSFRSPLDLDRLARRAGCSRSALLRSFRRAYGVTPGAYQRRLRVQEAIVLLRTTAWSVECIAATVGYASVKNLYGALRAFTGASPRAIRQSGDA